MKKTRSVQQAVRWALAMATASAALPTAHAQTAPAQPAEETAAPVQEVVITGSRLKAPNETSISPITTVSATDVQATGLTRVEDVLNNLPMVFAGMNSTTSNGADGTASVDLRGLGNQRTLVLVDGLRLGPGSALGGRNYSDINEIPAALIERVDVLTGGASAVYGADAVAGVVNFVLNTHFEGVKVDAGYHFNEHSNDDQDHTQALVSSLGFALPPGTVDTAFGKDASIIAGSNFADNRGNATAYITYDNQGYALQNRFDYSSCSLGISHAALACTGSGTSAKNGAGGKFYASTPHGVSFIVDTVDGKTGLFRPFVEPNDLYNFGPLNYYQTPSERWTGGVFLNYDVNSHVNVYTSVMYMRNSSQAQIAPSGDFGEPSFIPCADPLLTAQEVSVLCAPGNVAANGGGYEVYNGTTYPGLNMFILRRNVEGGDRIATFINNDAREVVGMKGDLNSDAWTYNVYAQHSTVENSNTNENYLGNQLLEQALNVLPNATAGGAPVCGGPTGTSGPLVTPGTGFTVNPKCVPWNIWVPNGVTQSALGFMSLPLLIEGSVEEYVSDASVTGDLTKYGWKTPWADQGLQVNVGAEWRSESSSFLPDYEEQQGNAGGGGGAVPPIAGSFNVKEAFTELRLPLATQQPMAEDLSIEGGYRYSKYSEGFDTNTYKLGLEWAPVRDLRLRGSYQRAVRAPNIGELYSPQAVGLDGSEDPCTGPTPKASLAACEATGLNPALYGHLNPNPADQYNGLLGGNPNLKPEIADSYTLGVVLTPRILPTLTLSVDYFEIKIRDLIGVIGGNTILNDCVATLSPTFCDLVHRDPQGSLWRTPLGFVTDTTVNEGELYTTGVDLKGSYRQALPLGSLLFALEGTYQEHLETTPVPGFGSYDCTGYYGDICGGGNPKWRHVLNITWSTPWDGLDLNLRWRYFGASDSEQSSSNLFLTGTDFLPGLDHIPAFNYIDLEGTFNLYKNIRLTLGVNNIADKAPPIVTGSDCSTSSPAGANCNGNTFPGVYDALGRYIFAHVTAQF
jgi:iron complex outermembrane recepter protein